MNVSKWSAIVLLCMMSTLAFAQTSEEQQKKERPKDPSDTIVWHGQFLSLNLVPVVKAAFSPDWGIQLQYNCNLYNRFLPAAEFGYARLRGTRDLNSYQTLLFRQTLTSLYRGHGLYGKIGVDVPIAKKGPDANNLFYVGLRYAFASYNYELLTVPFWPGYWSDGYSMNITGQHSLAHWLELVAGLRVEITPSISLGWSFYYKHLLGKTNTESSVAPYVPGYGAAENWVPGISAWFYWRMPW